MRLQRLLLPVLVLVLALLHARPAAAGYTHYWRWHARPDPAALGRCLDDMNRIVEARRGLLTDQEGRTQGAAVFRAQVVFAGRDGGPQNPRQDGGDPGDTVPAIVFNGTGDDGHEAFGFPLAPFTAESPPFQFVKTASKPYDEVVVACLITARDCFPHDVLTLTSDGTWAEWAQGAALYEKVLGRKAKNPLDPPGELRPSEITTARAAPTAGPGATSREGAREGAPSPDRASPRKKVLLGVIVLLALAIAFVLTREGR